MGKRTKKAGFKTGYCLWLASKNTQDNDADNIFTHNDVLSLTAENWLAQNKLGLSKMFTSLSPFIKWVQTLFSLITHFWLSELGSIYFQKLLIHVIKENKTKPLFFLERCHRVLSLWAERHKSNVLGVHHLKWTQWHQWPTPRTSNTH